MARKTKDATPGRVTPKGGPPKRVRAGSSSEPADSSGRYTAPIPRQFREGSRFVPIIMLGFFAAGILLILFNYLGILGKASNAYLFIGLGLIVCGFVASTQWR